MMSEAMTSMAPGPGNQINLALFEAAGRAHALLEDLLHGKGTMIKAMRTWDKLNTAKTALDQAMMTLGQPMSEEEKVFAFHFAIRKAQTVLEGLEEILERKGLNKNQRAKLPELLAVLNNTAIGLSHDIRDTVADRTKIINPTTTLQELHTAWTELHRATPYHGKFREWEPPESTDGPDQEIFDLIEACGMNDFTEIVDPFILHIDSDDSFLLTDLIRAIESCFHNRDVSWLWGYFAFRYIHILGTRDPRFLEALSIKLFDLTLLYCGTNDIAAQLHFRMDLPILDILERWKSTGHSAVSRVAIALILGTESDRPAFEDEGEKEDALDTMLEHVEEIGKWAKHSTVENAIDNPEMRNTDYYVMLENAAFAFGRLVHSLGQSFSHSHGQPFMRKVFLDLICTEVKRASKDLDVLVPSFREAINTRRLEAINSRLLEIRTANKERLSQ